MERDKSDEGTERGIEDKGKEALDDAEGTEADSITGACDECFREYKQGYLTIKEVGSQNFRCSLCNDALCRSCKEDHSEYCSQFEEIK